jgi:hypothetical protein
MYVGNHRIGTIFKFGPRRTFIAQSHPTYEQNQGIALDSHGNVFDTASGPPLLKTGPRLVTKVLAVAQAPDQSAG